MFVQFLQTQASVPAPQASHIKSECTLDPEVFTKKESSIEQVYECLETFRISLNFKITLNLDCMPTPETHIAYIFFTHLWNSPRLHCTQDPSQVLLGLDKYSSRP